MADWSAVFIGFAIGIVAGFFAFALSVVGHVGAGLVAGVVAVDSAIGGAILIQRENPALPAKDECSDALSEPRTEQDGSESRKFWGETAALLLVLSLQRFKTCF